MKLILNQHEITAAIRDYAIKQGLALRDKAIEVNLTAGRKENGFSAELDIIEATTDAVPTGPLTRAGKVVEYNLDETRALAEKAKLEAAVLEEIESEEVEKDMAEASIVPTTSLFNKPDSTE